MRTQQTTLGKLLKQVDGLHVADKTALLRHLRDGASAAAWPSPPRTAFTLSPCSSDDPADNIVPRIGRKRPALLNAIYDSQQWRERWRPGLEIHVYALGCRGLERIANELGEPLAKVGTCEVGALDRRRRELNGYGALYRADRRRYADEPGWTGWQVFPRLQLAPQHPAAPVRATGQSLIVTLPQEMSHGQVEAAIVKALRGYTLQAFATSDEGHRRCVACELAIDRLHRFSRVGPGLLDVAAATELVLIRPQADAPCLAALVEAIIVDRVLGHDLIDIA